MDPWQTPNMRLIGSTVHLQQAAREAEYGVMWSGGGNTTPAFLLAGKPVVWLSNQMQPFMQGLRVQQLGVGFLVAFGLHQALALVRLHARNGGLCHPNG